MNLVKNFYNYNVARRLDLRLPTTFDNKKKYILKEEDLASTFETWNISSEEYNEQKQTEYDEADRSDKENMKKIEENYNNKRPIFTSDKRKLYTSDKIYLYKKTDLDRLKYIIKNLTLLNDDELLEKQLITYNITKVLQLDQLENIFNNTISSDNSIEPK